jgi:uncharacterized protein YigE (DUF2233 family)
MRLAILFLSALLLFTIPADTASAFEAQGDLKIGWNVFEDGLELGVFVSPQASEAGDSLIRVLRIDPQHFRLRLLNASAGEDRSALTAKQWCLQNGLIAAINASMYQQDYRTSVSLMRTRNHVNNSRLSKDMTVLAFDRRREDVPHVKIIDRECDDFKTLKDNYGTLVQSIRMLSCKGKNVWAQQPQSWSTAAVGTDSDGRVLFVHVRSPFSTHDLINSLKKLPLNLSRLMYTEGGPQAQLYIRHHRSEYEFIGAFGPDLGEGNNLFARPIPNVLGIERRNPDNR